MARITILLALAATMAVPASGADRLTDKDVKQLVARIEQGWDRFDDALEETLKRSILRDWWGEVDVDEFLDDLQESIDRLEERLEPAYAASAEVAALLRLASSVDAYFRRQPTAVKGESEWNRLATDLKLLAHAYGAQFPLADHATVRRMGDREVAAALHGVATSLGRAKKSLKAELEKAMTIDQPTRQHIVHETAQLAKDAKAVRDRVRDGEPSSAEAEALIARAARLQSLIASRQLPTSAGAWSEIKSRLREIADAYDIPQALHEAGDSTPAPSAHHHDRARRPDLRTSR